MHGRIEEGDQLQSPLSLTTDLLTSASVMAAYRKYVARLTLPSFLCDECDISYGIMYSTSSTYIFITGLVRSCNSGFTLSKSVFSSPDNSLVKDERCSECRGTTENMKVYNSLYCFYEPLLLSLICAVRI